MNKKPVYIEKKVRCFCIKDKNGFILHDYFATEKDAKKFVKGLNLQYEFIKKPAQYTIF